MRIARAVGWSAGQKPTAAPGLSVADFATGLSHPRWLYVLPNGDVLVAESNAPANSDTAPLSGYNFVPFVDGHPSGMPEDILTGFVNGHGDAQGRPVGVTVDRADALLVADDVGDTIWRVTPQASVSATTAP